MKLLPTQIDERSLSGFGEEASVMLIRHDYSGLAKRFGYALAYDREPAAAMEEDYLRAAASPFEAMPEVKVKYFKPNSTGLFAAVACTVPVAGKAAVLLELIVTGIGEEMHITVEDINPKMHQA